MTDIAKNLCVRGDWYNYARRYTYKAAPNGYTVVEMKAYTSD